MHTILVTFSFTCQHDQLVGVCSGRLKKGGLRCGTARKGGCGSNSKKGDLRCGSAKKKGGLYNGTYPVHTLNIYVSAPPPPPGYVLPNNNT